MFNSKFSLSQAYYKGGKIVVDNFTFFVTATGVGIFISAVYLLILGGVDFIFLKNNIFSLLKLFQEIATSSMGSLHHENFSVHSALVKHIPQEILEHFFDMNTASFNIAKEDVKNIIGWIIPTALVLKLCIDTITIGWIKIALDLNQNKKVSVKYLYEYYYLVLKYFIVNLVVNIATIFGLMLFIVPGIFVYQRLRFAKFFIIDKNLTIVNALQSSWALTQDSVLDLTGFSLISTMLSNIANFVLILRVFILPLQIQTETNVYQELLNK